MARGQWLAILGLAFAVRAIVAFLVLGDLPYVADAGDYVMEARLLVRDFPGAKPYFWPPGMPYLLAGALALFGGGDITIRLTAIAASVITVALVMHLAGQLSDDTRVPRIAGLIGALFPPDVIMAGQPYSQQLSALCLVALITAGLRGARTGRWHWWLIAGLALGVGCLTRPSMASVTVIGLGLAGLVIVLRPAARPAGFRLIRGGVVTLVVTGTVLLPVMRFNASLGGGWGVSTNNERNLFLGNNPHTPHYKTGHLAQRPIETLEPEVRAYLTEIYTRPAPREAMMQEARRYILSHPWITALRTANRVRAFWGFDYGMSRQIQLHRRLGLGGTVPWLIVEASGYFIVAALALAGLIGYWGAMRPDCRWWILVAVGAYQLPYALSFSAGGYHFPAMFLLIPCAAVAMAGGLGPLWARVRARPLIWVALLLLGAVQLEYAYFVFRSL